MLVFDIMGKTVNENCVERGRKTKKVNEEANMEEEGTKIREKG